MATRNRTARKRRRPAPIAILSRLNHAIALTFCARAALEHLVNEGPAWMEIGYVDIAMRASTTALRSAYNEVDTAFCALGRERVMSRDCWAGFRFGMLALFIVELLICIAVRSGG
jgi:hypothetical protein